MSNWTKVIAEYIREIMITGVSFEDAIPMAMQKYNDFCVEMATGKTERARLFKEKMIVDLHSSINL